MKKAKIYIPTKSPMQSGMGKNDKWLISQYNLLLPIPNDLLIEYSKEIKEFLINN